MNHSPELLKGSLQTIVLKVLADFGKMYGYEITQMVKELSDGKIEITEGALYPTLHKLEAEGILKTEVKYIGNRMRKYYMLTKAGNAEVTERVSELEDFLSVLRSILKSKATA